MIKMQYNSLLIFVIICISCSSTKQNEVATANKIARVSNALPNTLIYKMRQDYSKNVPILMNTQKDQIISYPAPSDVCPEGNCLYPTLLIDSFWLDNKGINRNVAFLEYTYEEYKNLPFAPAPSELFDKIIDKEPLIQLYDFGKRKDFNNLEDELNIKIINKEYINKYNLVTK